MVGTWKRKTKIDCCRFWGLCVGVAVMGMGKEIGLAGAFVKKVVAYSVELGLQGVWWRGGESWVVA